MINALVYIDRHTKKIVRTEPPQLMQVVRVIEEANILVVPQTVFDLNTFNVVPVNFRFVAEKK